MDAMSCVDCGSLEVGFIEPGLSLCSRMAMLDLGIKFLRSF